MRNCNAGYKTVAAMNAAFIGNHQDRSLQEVAEAREAAARS
jgi:hypothetical protein